MSHTQGPWVAGPLDADGVPIYSGPEDTAELVAYVLDVQSADTEANARLIAAAPEMAVALKALVRAEECNYELPTMRYEGLFDQARAALATATGTKGVRK